jgi:hypothetical protein
MQYLLNPRKKISAAHLWLGNDTACKMYSTGGLRPERQKIFDTPMEKKICLMCSNNMRKVAQKPKSD